MCFDPISLGLTGLGMVTSGIGTNMQNQENNKAYRKNVMGQAMADAQNRQIDYANNDRINADIRAAEQIQFQGLQQDAEEAAARNQVLAEYTARQREAAAANDKTFNTALPTFGAAGTTQQLADASQQRGDFAAQAVSGGGATDANFRGSTPDMVRRMLDSSIQGSRQTATDQARAGAAVSAFGDVNTRQGIGLADMVGKIGLQNNFAKGDMSLLPADQELRGSLVRKPIYAPPPTLLQDRVSRPEQVKPEQSTAGALLKGFGQLAGTYAGSGRAPTDFAKLSTTASKAFGI